MRKIPVIGQVLSGFPQESLCHLRVQEVIEQVDGYFPRRQPLEQKKTRQKFVTAGFSTVTYYYFPKALDDRIHFACSC
jgi:aristolochene synthase